MSNGDAFVASLLAWTHKTDEELNIIVRKIVFGVFYNIVMGSPVDTGRFIGNWQIGLGVIPQGTLDALVKDKTFQAAIGSDKLSSAKAGGVIFIANNLPYALALEYGHSQQAPQGMVRRTLANINAITEGARL
jgi:hypothetical protein